MLRTNSVTMMTQLWFILTQCERHGNWENKVADTHYKSPPLTFPTRAKWVTGGYCA